MRDVELNGEFVEVELKEDIIFRQEEIPENIEKVHPMVTEKDRKSIMT